MGPCQSLSSKTLNEKKNKYTLEHIEGQNKTNEHNTNNTKNNINHSLHDRNFSEGDLKFKSTMAPSDSIKNSNLIEESINKKIGQEIEIKKKKFPFLPHIYNSLSNEDITFYHTLIEIQQSQNFFAKSVYSLEDLKISILTKISIENEFDKLILCWRIFNWIVSNIKCVEYSKQTSPDTDEFSLNSIFILRSTNSYGIAKLFNYLTELVNVHSETIPGYLKTKNFIDGNSFSHINHYWNAVSIFGQLRLIDCSCAGETENPHTNKFPQFYFCAIPQHLIYTHFPKDIDQSCLTNVKVLMDLKSFEQLNIFSKNYFIYGFQLGEFKNGEIDFDDLLLRNSNENIHLNEVNLDFCLPDRILPSIHLIKENSNEDLNRIINFKRRIFDKEDDRKKINTIDYYFYYESFLFKSSMYENVFKILDGLVVYDISIRLPERGNYKLQLSANVKANEEEEGVICDELASSYCFSYKIQAEVENFKQYNYEDLMYPLTTESFLIRNCEINEPLFYRLESFFINKKNIHFSVKIPEAIDAAIFYDTEDEFVIMDKKEDGVFTYVHSIEKKFERINIAANFGESEYVILITYEL